MAYRIKQNGSSLSYNLITYITDNDGEIADLPTDALMGSTAESIGTGNIYKLNSAGEWILQPTSGSTSGGAIGTYVTGIEIVEGMLVAHKSDGTSTEVGEVPSTDLSDIIVISGGTTENI